MKGKIYKLTLVYARAKRRALRCVPSSNILPMKVSITLHCHCSCIHATHSPTHCKPETTQKNACTPFPRAGDAPFGPAQDLATSWGWHTTIPDAMKKLVHLSMQPVFSHITNQKPEYASKWRPPPRPSDALFGWSLGPTFSNSLGTVNYHPQCNENCAL